MQTSTIPASKNWISSIPTTWTPISTFDSSCSDVGTGRALSLRSSRETTSSRLKRSSISGLKTWTRWRAITARRRRRISSSDFPENIPPAMISIQRSLYESNGISSELVRHRITEASRIEDRGSEKHRGSRIEDRGSEKLRGSGGSPVGAIDNSPGRSPGILDAEDHPSETAP